MANKYLVTGAMGCIGAWVLKHLAEQGKQTISFDLSTDRHRLDLLMPSEEQEAITFIQGDLTDYEQVETAVNQHGITHIIHLAALQVPFCRADPVLGSQVNVVGTVNIFESALKADIKHVALASSIAVYGGVAEYPEGLVTHDAPRKPHTLYGVYKVANEDTARVYWQDYGVSSLGLRPYTVYGVGRDQGLTSDPTKAILAAIKGEPFEIGFGGKMQFQLASDVALQFIDASEQKIEGSHFYNLGTPVTHVDEFVSHIQHAIPNTQITRTDTILPFPEGFDDTELKTAVGTVYETPLQEGIAQTIEHFKSKI
ncbi:MAG: SDR family NAD(P)-dependent oxidoreductase [Chloroflexota bacterium]